MLVIEIKQLIFFEVFREARKMKREKKQEDFFFKFCGLLRIYDRSLVFKDVLLQVGFRPQPWKTAALRVPQKPARNIQPFHHKYYIAVQCNIAEQHILVLNCGQLLYHPLTLYALKVSKIQKQVFLISFEPKTKRNHFLISGPLASVRLWSFLKSGLKLPTIV